MEALKQYITVKYVRMADFLLECTVAWDEKRYDKVLQAYARPKLFIIDEWLDIELTKNDLHAIKELVHRCTTKNSRPPAIFSLRPLWGLAPALEKKAVF